MYTSMPPGIYAVALDVTMAEFRRDLVNLVEQAMIGIEIHVTHKGGSFTLKPDGPPPDKLSRITPLDIVVGDLDDRPDKEEMRRAWERDWADL